MTAIDRAIKENRRKELKEIINPLNKKVERRYYYTAKLPSYTGEGFIKTYGYIHARNKKEAILKLSGTGKKFKPRYYNIKVKTSAELDKKEAKKMKISVKQYRKFMKSFE